MKKAVPLLLFASLSAQADDSWTNSNNTQTSTQEITNTYAHDGATDSHNIDNSLTTHDGATDSHAVDNSIASHNSIAVGSNNQDSHQVINNTNTEGDLQNSKNTGSFNTNSYNTDSSGSGNTLTASGGTSFSTSAGGSSQSDSNSSATGGAGGNSQSGSASSITASGNSANTLGSQSSAGVTGSGNSQNDNASRATNNGSGNSKVLVQSSSVYRQVHQAPGLGSLFGQVSQNQFSCSSSVGLNFSFLLGGAGFTLPWANDRCELLVAAAAMNNLFGFSAACNLMRDGDDEFRLAMNRANVNCNPVIPPPTIAVPRHEDLAIPKENNVIFDTVHKTVMQK